MGEARGNIRALNPVPTSAHTEISVACSLILAFGEAQSFQNQ